MQSGKCCTQQLLMDRNGQNRHPRCAWWGVPFARSPKAMVIARVLKDRYLRSALLPDISVAALSTFTVRPGAGLSLPARC